MPRPPTRHTFEARLIAYAKEMKPSEWIKAQPAFVGLRRQLPRYKFDCANWGSVEAKRTPLRPA